MRMRGTMESTSSQKTRVVASAMTLYVSELQVRLYISIIYSNLKKKTQQQLNSDPLVLWSCGIIFLS